MLRSLAKSVVAIPLVQWVLSGIAALYILLTKYTALTSRDDPPPCQGPVIIAMWHGRLAQLHFLRQGHLPLVALVSGHRDGQLIKKCAWHFGVAAVTGSTSRNGRRGASELIKQARAGHSIFITPDGPRGPRLRASVGIVKLSRLTGFPIVPAAISTSRTIEMRSWDGFRVPLPFARTAVRWGKPISCERGDNPESARQKLEQELSDLQQIADQAVGLSAPDAAPRFLSHDNGSLR